MFTLEFEHTFPYNIYKHMFGKWVELLRDLQRYLASGTPVDIIYLDRAGRITKRRLRLLSIDEDHVRAYCYTRRAPRTFAIANILAVQPVMRRAV